MNLMAMFRSATSFNQDISGWVVHGIAEPWNFATNCPITPAHKPNFS